jgi:hypothetical protein
MDEWIGTKQERFAFERHRQIQRRSSAGPTGTASGSPNIDRATDSPRVEAVVAVAVAVAVNAHDYVLRASDCGGRSGSCKCPASHRQVTSCGRLAL